MSCQKTCEGYKELNSDLESAVNDLADSSVTKFFEDRIQEYCSGCLYNGEKGTGERVLIGE